MTQLRPRAQTLSAALEYASKLLVILSMVAALFIEASLAGRAWPGLLPLTAGSFLAAAVLSLLSESLAASLVLFLAYLGPGLLFLVHGDFTVSFGTWWVAALVGAMLPRSLRSSWAFPVRWKPPLILWALTIACTWPVVVLRELDFTPALVNMIGLPASVLRVNPPVASLWICDVAAILGVGILWFDWLFLVFDRDEPRFRRSIVVALAASWAIATAVGIYQLFGDMQFLNTGLFGYLRRASGTMRDANPFGVIAALWGPALIAAAWLTPSRPLRGLALFGLLASWVGAWASAGRTASGAGFVALAFIVYAVWAGSPLPRTLSRRTWVVVGVLLVLVLVSLPLALVQLPIASGPIPRFRLMLPALSMPSIISFLKALSNRNGYGLVATQLIREFPWFGIGIGSFHVVVPDYFFLLTRRIIPGDNAQNWFRHQLAENGLVGSLGWIGWVATFCWFLVSTRASNTAKLPSTIVKGLLVAIALVSLVGMPTQNVAVAITFWTFAFWSVALSDRSPQQRSTHGSTRLGFITWSAIGTIVVASVCGTAYTSRHRLRVPQRAVLAGWPYAYGFSDGGSDLSLARQSSVWAGRHAVAVLAPSTRWVKLTMSVDRFNVAKGPVDVKVWCDDMPVVAMSVGDLQPIIRYVPLRAGATRMMLETRVSRSVRPTDYGLTDNREHGLLVEWSFAEGPPLNR